MSFKFNPTTGKLDLVGGGDTIVSSNFSYKTIDSGESVTIPQNQQMIVDGHVKVLGHLSIGGELVDISGRKQEQFFYDLIELGEVVTIESKRLLMFKRHLRVNGHLRIKGRLEEV